MTEAQRNSLERIACRLEQIANGAMLFGHRELGMELRDMEVRIRALVKGSLSKSFPPPDFDPSRSIYGKPMPDGM